MDRLSKILRPLLAASLLIIPSLARTLPDRSPAPASTDQEINPGSGRRDLFYRRALDFLDRYRREDLGQAVRLLGQVIELDPRFAPAYGKLAEARALRYLWGWEPSLKGLDQALAGGLQAIKLDPELAEAHLGLGLAWMAADRYTPALAELDRAEALAPDSFKTHLYRGMLLRNLRRLEETRTEAARALELAPDSPLSYSLLGDSYLDRRDFPRARDAYLMAVQLDQRLLWPRLGLAAAYQRGLSFSGAEKTYLATEADFPDDSPRCQIMEASLLVATQEYEDALKIYEGIPTEKERLSPPLLHRLIQAGRAYSLEKLGKKEQAEYYWAEMVEEFPLDFDGSVRDREVASQAYEALVRYHDEKGQTRRAQALLDQACQREGMAFSLYANLAERHRNAGRLGLAVATLRKGVRSAPEDLDLVTTTGAILPILRSVAAQKSSRSTRQAARTLLDGLATRLASVPSETHTPYLNLAKAEALLQEYSKALLHLRLAVEKGFGGIEAMREDPDLKDLAGNPGLQELTRPPQPGESGASSPAHQ